MDAEFEERARRRRQTWVGGRVRGFGEAELADDQFWEQATGSERLSATWQMALDALVIAASNEITSGLQGLSFGTRQRRS